MMFWDVKQISKIYYFLKNCKKFKTHSDFSFHLKNQQITNKLINNSVIKIQFT